MNDELQRQSEALASQFDTKGRRALVVGVAGIVLAGVGYTTDADHFFQSWLIGFTYWLSLTLGCLMILFIHNLAGGRWGFALRRLLEAGTRTLPLMFVLGLPVLAGMHSLYEWTHAEHVVGDEFLEHKAPYLNSTFFIIRYFACFLLWGGMVALLNRWSGQQDESADDTSPTRRMQILSGPGIVLFVLLCTIASVDWLMSLEPHWFSTIFSAIYIIGQALMAWAFMVLVAVPLSRQKPLNALLTNERLRDIGTFMLGFVMLWAYTSFSQLLIIWAGNLPEEITWYYTRLQGSWVYVGYGLIGFHFAVPFLLMVSSRIKARVQVLISVALGLMLMRFLDLYWITAPALQHGESHSAMPHWLDLVVPVGIGGIWLYVFFGQLKKRSLVPLNDPRFDFEALAAEAHEEH
ncbi:MAG: hypothetical protein VX733_06590 [Candidatus Latescibacterota bacterium]|nr:hypothetical protein [Candidatus Latescibacterota bacterium]